MAKELEAFKNIMKVYGNTNSLEGTYDDFLTIKKALKRLEAIDNAKPNEAMKTLNRLAYENACCRCEYYNDDKCYNKNECVWTIIKQTLIKFQEQEKTLKVIKEKNVNIGLVNVLGSVEQYNQTYVYDNMLNVKWCLTEEEFDLLKRWLDNDTL